MADKIFDVTIVGGGFVGLSLALSLKSMLAQSVRVKLIEKPKIPEDDNRASALNQGSVKMLTTLGVMDQLAKKTYPITKMEILSHALDDPSRLPLLTLDEGGDPNLPLATMVENIHLLKAIEAKVNKLDIARETGDHAAPFQTETDYIQLEGGAKTRLLVAADGASSQVRKAAGIKTLKWDYKQMGLTAKVRHERPHHHTAVQSFLPSGPFARLPLAENTASFVWSEESAEASRLLDLPEPAFAAELQRRFGGELGAIELLSKPAAWPLSMMLAREFGASRLVLVGDAAHKVHPLAGQGLNLGLRDVAALTEVVADHMRLGLDPGAETVVKRYVEWRRFDNVVNAFTMDSLNRMHRFRNPLADFVRQTGMSLIDRSSWAKTQLGKAAAGFSGEVPKLLQGELA